MVEVCPQRSPLSTSLADSGAFFSFSYQPLKGCPPTLHGRHWGALAKPGLMSGAPLSLQLLRCMTPSASSIPLSTPHLGSVELQSWGSSHPRKSEQYPIFGPGRSLGLESPSLLALTGPSSLGLHSAANSEPPPLAHARHKGHWFAVLYRLGPSNSLLFSTHQDHPCTFLHKGFLSWPHQPLAREVRVRDSSFFPFPLKGAPMKHLSIFQRFHPPSQLEEASESLPEKLGDCQDHGIATIPRGLQSHLDLLHLHSPHRG